MIIYGKSAEKIKALEVLPAPCPTCDSKNSLQGIVLMRYAHIYYIPFFPLGKRVVTVCTQCKASYKSAQLDGQNALAISDLTVKTKTPLQYWILSFIIGALVLVGFISSLLK